jgi:hypothetical protein
MCVVTESSRKEKSSQSHKTFQDALRPCQLL